MATPKPPTRPAADFSKLEGQGFENVSARDFIDLMPEWQRYWRVWLDHEIPFALLKAWRACRNAGVAVSPEMQEAVNAVLERIAAEDTAQGMAEAITDGRGRQFSMHNKLLELDREPLIALIRDLLELKSADQPAADVFRLVARWAGDTDENIKKLWQRRGGSQGG